MNWIVADWTTLAIAVTLTVFGFVRWTTTKARIDRHYGEFIFILGAVATSGLAVNLAWALQ